MPRPVVHLIPHTHWDREWYLPLGAFRARLVAALDELIDLLEHDARITTFYLDGQAVLLEDYLELRPERAAAAAALVQNRRLQIGPWYVLADEQIPAGESLVRNLLLGGSASRRLGGSAGVLYSPDAFGHPACLPALAHEFRLVGGVLWRGVGPSATGGRDLAWWESASGGRVLVYHLPPAGYEIGSNLLVPRPRLAEAWRRVAGQILPRAATRHVALLVGADHHAPVSDLGDLAAALAEVAPECEFRFSRLDDFLELAAREGRDLPVLRGEQRDSYGYTWTLQGVHATRAAIKRRNSAVELALGRLAEPLVAVTERRSDRGAAVVRYAWREVVQSQFHDAIGGCTSDDVARAVAARFTEAESAAAELIRSGLERLAGHDADLARQTGSERPCLLIWNPAARPRGGVVLADLTFFRRDVIVGPAGHRVPRTGPGFVPFVLGRSTDASAPGSEIAPQILAVDPGLERLDAPRHYPEQAEVDRVRIAFHLAQPIGGFEARRLGVKSGVSRPAETLATASGTRVSNGRLEVAVAVNGTAAIRPPGRGKVLTGLFGLESEPDVGDCYTFCPVPRTPVVRATRSGRPRVTAAGPLVAGLEWGLSLRTARDLQRTTGRVSARVELQVIGDSPVVRCRVSLENRARDHRLRLRFPTGLTRAPVIAGTQFGAVERAAAAPIGGRHTMETPVATAPAHRFVAAARGRHGLAILAPGFFEYEWTARGDLLVTLLRCVGELSRSDLATRPGHAAWPMPTPEAQCLGTETIALGLAPITEEEIRTPGLLERLWEDTYVPPVAHWIRCYQAAEPLPDRAIGCHLEGEGLVLSALKPAEDGRGAVLRCYNVRQDVVGARLRLSRPIARATMIRADETPVGELPLSESGQTVAFTVPASGMTSVRLEWAD